MEIYILAANLDDNCFESLYIALFEVQHNILTQFGFFAARDRHARSYITKTPPSTRGNSDTDFMVPLTEELKIKLIEILNLTDVSPEDFDENAQLVGGDLGIDSIDVLEMVVMVEKEYGVVINSQEVGEKVFRSLTALADYIKDNAPG